MEILKYTDERDLCYGLTGMAVSLFIYDSEQYLDSLSLDAEAAEAFAVTPEFSAPVITSMSAKALWQHNLHQYEVTVGLAMSNLLCRALSGRGCQPEQEAVKAVHDFALEQGHEMCALEDDEIEALYKKNYNYLAKVFGHHSVRSIIDDFVFRLQQRRTMSRDEVFDILRALQML